MRVTHHRTGQELAKRHLPGFGGNPNQFFASSTAIFPLGGVFRSVVLVLHSRKIYLLTQTHSHIHRALNTPWGLLHHLGPHEDSTELSRPPSTTTLPTGVLWFYATCFFLCISAHCSHHKDHSDASGGDGSSSTQHTGQFQFWTVVNNF